MIWLRKGFVHFLSVILLVCLVGLASATGFSRDLGNTTKLKSWLASSNIYNHVVPAELNQSQQSNDNDDGSGSVSFNDPAVQQAAKTAFSPALIENSVNTFLDGNYNWLAGKTKTPDFTINLTSAKQQFANLVGQSAQTHLASLPVCSAAQLAQLTIPVDSLSISCRPATLSPQAENTRISQEVNNSTDFLSNPVITASSVSQNSQSQPYYQKLSWAPRAYQIILKLPWILGGLGLLCVLGIVFIAPSRRRGVRRIGVVLVEAGILLIIEKLAADALVKKFSTSSLKPLNSTLANQLKQPINDFLSHSESQLVQFYLWFGILFLIAGVIILAYVFKTRERKANPKKFGASQDNATNAEPVRTDASNIHLAPRRGNQPAVDVGLKPMPPKMAVPGAQPASKNPPRPKRPRLIQ